MKLWYVANTKHQQEVRAADELREQGYEAYLPKLFRHHTHPQYAKKPHEIRFSGYVFVRFDLALGEHGPIRNTRGIDSGDGPGLLADRLGTPISLPEFVIPDLQRIEDLEFARAILRAKPMARADLQDGDLVRIDNRDNHLHGQKGILLKRDKGIARVLVGMMGWKVAEADLKLVDQQKGKAA